MNFLNFFSLIICAALSGCAGMPQGAALGALACVASKGNDCGRAAAAGALIGAGAVALATTHRHQDAGNSSLDNRSQQCDRDEVISITGRCVRPDHRNPRCEENGGTQIGWNDRGGRHCDIARARGHRPHGEVREFLLFRERNGALCVADQYATHCGNAAREFCSRPGVICR